MALVFNQTKNSQPANQQAVGYTKPVVTEFTDYEYIRRVNLSIDAVTVDNATPATTQDNIYEDAAIGINKQLNDILVADYDTVGLTVTAWADCLSITTNKENNINTAFYNDDALSYVATVILYVKTA